MLAAPTSMSRDISGLWESKTSHVDGPRRLRSVGSFGADLQLGGVADAYHRRLGLPASESRGDQARRPRRQRAEGEVARAEADPDADSLGAVQRLLQRADEVRAILGHGRRPEPNPHTDD